MGDWSRTPQLHTSHDGNAVGFGSWNLTGRRCVVTGAARGHRPRNGEGGPGARSGKACGPRRPRRGAPGSGGGGHRRSGERPSRAMSPTRRCSSGAVRRQWARGTASFAKRGDRHGHRAWGDPGRLDSNDAREHRGARDRRAAAHNPAGWSAARALWVTTASAAGLLTQIGDAPVLRQQRRQAVSFAEWLAITYGDRGIQGPLPGSDGRQTPNLLQRRGWTRTSQSVNVVAAAGEILEPEGRGRGGHGRDRGQSLHGPAASRGRRVPPPQGRRHRPLARGHAPPAGARSEAYEARHLPSRRSNGARRSAADRRARARTEPRQGGLRRPSSSGTTSPTRAPRGGDPRPVDLHGGRSRSPPSAWLIGPAHPRRRREGAVHKLARENRDARPAEQRALSSSAPASASDNSGEFLEVSARRQTPRPERSSSTTASPTCSATGTAPSSPQARPPDPDLARGPLAEPPPGAAGGEVRRPVPCRRPDARGPRRAEGRDPAAAVRPRPSPTSRTSTPRPWFRSRPRTWWP